MRLLSLVAVLCTMLLAACDTAPGFENAVSSTPINDLPISIDAPSVGQAIPTPVAQSIIDEADAEYVLLSNIYERTTPSVVNVEADLYSDTGIYADTSRGSGFVYDMNGHIITNAHVVSGSRDVRVTFNDGYVAEADIVGIDTYSDIGVVKIDVPVDRLSPLRIVDSDSVRVGQRAIAIGNPFGLSSSMSVGIVSGLGRTLRSAALIDATALPGFQNPAIIQTDAPINPGNSGGPLLNSSGDVIGVNTAIRTENGVFQGVGFAVPANTVRRVVPELIENGSVDYSWVGISVEPEANGFGVAGLAEPLGLPVDAGVLIRGVTIGSPADKAGLQGGNRIVEVRGVRICTGGDIIIAIDGHYVDNMDELVAYLVVNTAPGDTVDLLVVRDRDTFQLPMTLESRPTNQANIRDGCS